MRSTKIVPADAECHFWTVVERCIREFHRGRASTSLKKLQGLKSRLSNVPIEEYELFFHAEPFDVACDLADQELRVEDHLQRYLEIRDSENPLSP